MDHEKTELWDYIIDNGFASDETLRIITSINGYSIETLNDILYATTGYRSLEQIEGEGEGAK